jgi:hypothetical protein
MNEGVETSFYTPPPPTGICLLGCQESGYVWQGARTYLKNAAETQYWHRTCSMHKDLPGWDMSGPGIRYVQRMPLEPREWAGQIHQKDLVARR